MNAHTHTHTHTHAHTHTHTHSCTHAHTHTHTHTPAISPHLDRNGRTGRRQWSLPRRYEICLRWFQPVKICDVGRREIVHFIIENDPILSDDFGTKVCVNSPIKQLWFQISKTVYNMIKINEPQLPWLRTAIIYHTGLDVKMEVTRCAGRISANTRHHQLCWGDREWAYYMSCTRKTCYMYNVHYIHLYMYMYYVHVHVHYIQCTGTCIYMYMYILKAAIYMYITTTHLTNTLPLLPSLFLSLRLLSYTPQTNHQTPPSLPLTSFPEQTPL